MIQISLTTATILYSAILGIAALIMWIYTEVRAQHQRDVLEKQNLWKCSICGFSYLDDSGAPISRCPRCASYSIADEKDGKTRPGTDEPRTASRKKQTK